MEGLVFLSNGNVCSQLIAEANYGTVNVLERIDIANDFFKMYPKETECNWKDGMAIIRAN